MSGTTATPSHPDRKLRAAIGCKTLTRRSAPLGVVMGALWAAAAAAGSVTASKDCMTTPCTVTEAKFSLPTGQTVTWEATYSGTPTQGHRFYLSQANSSQADIQLTTTAGELGGTKFLAAGFYYISIRTALMGPGFYTVSGPTLVGDPHITTINGVRYDFQGAGEFVSLRHPDGFELQTRMAPVATVSRPPPDPHTGVAACVSINSAVAAKVGKHRVTYQPNLSGRPDPKGLQLRVDGQLTVLGRQGKDLADGGRITKTAAPGGLMVEFPDRSSVTVTPNWWADQSVWYLDIAMFPPQGSRGLAGDVPLDGWLPVLPDGTSIGPKPGGSPERYAALYRKFGDAWRVADDTTLFDYADGTSTKTYTMQSWPPEDGPCATPFTVPVKGASEEVAQRACEKVVMPTARKNCIFDVMATGHTGFGKSYFATQGLQGKKLKLARGEGEERGKPRE
jgi:hypothetical protein